MIRQVIGLAFVLLPLAGCTSVSPASDAVSTSAPPAPVVAASPTNAESAVNAAAGTASDLSATVPFTVCESSETWVPPTEAEQAAHYWDVSIVIEGVSRLALWWSFAQDFVRYGGGSSEGGDLAMDFGRWKADPVQASPTDRSIADAPCPLDRVRTGDETQLWIRSHKVIGVERRRSNYTVTVAPATGFQIVNLACPLLPVAVVAPSIDVADAGGRVLSTLPPPPWAEYGIQPVDGAEAQVAGVLTEANPRDGYMTLVSDTGAEWKLPILDGTVIESADGTRALLTSPAPGSRVDVGGFAIPGGEEEHLLAAVRIKVLEP